MNRFLLLLTMFGATLAARAGDVLWIESENTMGVHRSKGTEAGSDKDRIIPVPWTRLWTPEAASTNCVTMSNLVSVANLSAASDAIKYFDTTDQVFKVWQWGGKTWGYIEDMHWRENAGADSLSSDTTLLERGYGLWLRVKDGGDVYLLGQSSTNAPVSTMAIDNNYDHPFEQYTENFVVNPCDTDVDLLEVTNGMQMVSNAVLDDEINVVTPTNSVLYWYKTPKGGSEAAWCTLEKTTTTVTMPWGPVKVTSLDYQACAHLPVPFGACVWYSCTTNNPHSQPPVIRWHHQEEFRK